MHLKLVLDGGLTEGDGVLEVVNPATGQPFATCARAGVGQLDLAVAAAHGAFPTWSALDHAARARHLQSLADAIESRSGEFARVLTMEHGKPLVQAEGECARAVLALRTFSQLQIPDVVLRQSGSEIITQTHCALGVVGVIVPWNFPLMIMAMKIAPALIAGNTVVAKASPTTPLTALMLGELALAALPPGVLNILVDANDLGPALTSHPAIAKISFTGSTATGRKVMGSGASTLKRLTLELGGNDAAIVLDDADIEATARKIFDGAMANSGQICIAPKRIYVPVQHHDAFAAEMAQLASQAVVGDGLDPATTIGPVQNRTQFEKLKDYLASASAEGTILSGGAAIDGGGYFIPPTIVTNLRDDARVVREEQFGPLLPILPYDAIEDALQRANATEYGLGASVWSSDPHRADAVARRMDAGTVWINKARDMQFDIPLRGAKQSGLGVENGEEGLREFLQAKVINAALP